MIPVGASVQIVAPVITGTVKRYGLADDGQTITHVVEYTDAQGNTQERHFTETELQPVEA